MSDIEINADGWSFQQDSGIESENFAILNSDIFEVAGMNSNRSVAAVLGGGVGDAVTVQIKSDIARLDRDRSTGSRRVTERLVQHIHSRGTDSVWQRADDSLCGA